MALSTIVALLTLVAVSGPHLVHHLAERPPHEHQHAQDGPQPRDHQTPPRPDCLVLFLMQHTPVAEEGRALLPTLLLRQSLSSPPFPSDMPTFPGMRSRRVRRLCSSNYPL